jgi:hypothetical protein
MEFTLIDYVLFPMKISTNENIFFEQIRLSVNLSNRSGNENRQKTQSPPKPKENA